MWQSTVLCDRSPILMTGIPQPPSSFPTIFYLSAENRTVYPSPDLVNHTAEWVKEHLRGVDPVPQFSGNCLQTNVFDNNFVLDFVPNTNKNIVIFTAGKIFSLIYFLCFFASSHPPTPLLFFPYNQSGWAMKFVPLLGKILTELLLKGDTKYDISHFKISRDKIIKPPPRILDIRFEISFPLYYNFHSHFRPGSTHFLGGKYAPSAYAKFGRKAHVSHRQTCNPSPDPPPFSHPCPHPIM